MRNIGLVGAALSIALLAGCAGAGLGGSALPSASQSVMHHADYLGGPAPGDYLGGPAMSHSGQMRPGDYLGGPAARPGGRMHPGDYLGGPAARPGGRMQPGDYLGGPAPGHH